MILSQDAPLTYLLTVLFIGTPVGAVLLKIACALFNMLASAVGRPARREIVGESEFAIGNKQGPTLTPDDAWEDHESMAASSGVPKPTFERALCIIFFAAFINAVMCFIVLRFLRLTGQVAGTAALSTVPFWLISYPLGILVLSGINAALLPTRFGKGLLIALIFSFLSILLAVVVLIALVFGSGISWFR